MLNESFKLFFSRKYRIKWVFILVVGSFHFGCEEKQETKQIANVLLICVDDLRPELNSFGASYIYSPNIDSLARKGVSFKNHFVNAPSCGPSRYTLLTGIYGPPNNNALFLRAQKIRDEKKGIHPSMPEWFRSHGYKTVSVGKVSHHPGGRGGKDWNDSTLIEMPNAWDRSLMPVGPWLHPRGAMHGLANGEIRKNTGDMDVYQSAGGSDVSYPDDLITAEALQQLQELTVQNDKPFFLAVGLIKPHLPFGAPQSFYELYSGIDLPPIKHPEKPQGKSTWHSSNEFIKYNHWERDPNEDQEFADLVRRHYAACVSYADAQIGKIITELKRIGADKNTIVVLWGDHGWHLGEHAIWGKHSLFEESLHSPLIIYDPTKTKNKNEAHGIVQTLDIFPTLCDLTGVEMPEFIEGISLKDISFGNDSINQSSIAYTTKAKTIRTRTHRLVIHNDGYAELYDHTSDGNETKNIAEQHPDLVKKLTQEINSKLQHSR